MTEAEISNAWGIIQQATPGPYERRQAGSGDCNNLLIWSVAADAPVATVFGRAEDARFFQAAIDAWPRAMRHISGFDLTRSFDVRLAELLAAAIDWRINGPRIMQGGDKTLPRLNNAIDAAIRSSSEISMGPYR